MRSRWRVVAVGVVVSAVACGGGDDESAGTAATTVPTDAVAEAPWGEEAVAWLDALEAAAENGSEHLESFFDPGLVWEDRIGDVLVHGAESWFGDRAEEELAEYFLPRGGARYFVSADELLRQQLVRFEQMPVSWLDRMEIRPDGIRRWIRSGSLDGGRWYQPRRSDYDGYDELADRYLALWNGSQDVDGASVYHPEATVSDTLLGESMSGVHAIDRSVGSGSWPVLGRMSILDLPDGAGRAVHAAPSDSGGMGPEEVRLLVEVDDGTGCPGLMAVALGLDGDRVDWELRYHDIESIRRCNDPTALQPGWWEGREIPASVFRERTGTITYGGLTIEVWNGTPDLEAFAELGLARFAEAGLPTPRVASITFIRARTACYEVGGTARWSERGADITLCRTTDDICLDETCRTWAPRHRQLLLHELAHPWLDEHADETVRAEFLDLVELPRWSDPSDRWDERGVEWAADAIAYGLMDDPVEIAPELATTCDERLAGFRVLTGAEPVAVCDG